MFRMIGYVVMINNDAVVNFSNNKETARAFCVQNQLSENQIKQVFVNAPDDDRKRSVAYNGLYEPDAQNILKPSLGE